MAEKQESRNSNIVYAVLVATFLVIATIAVQVSVSDQRDRARADNLLERVHVVELNDVVLVQETNQRLSEFKLCIWQKGLASCLLSGK